MGWAWAPTEIFVSGGGGQAQKGPPLRQKKAPTWKKGSKGSHMKKK